MYLYNQFQCAPFCPNTSYDYYYILSLVFHLYMINQLNCKNWQIEAAYRMIQHNLDQNVAENPDELIVYGGIGKAARNWESYHQILESLKELGNDETYV